MTWTGPVNGKKHHAVPLTELDLSSMKCRGECARILDIGRFKLYRTRHVLKNGEPRVYERRDTTCRQCRWNSNKDRVNKARRKGTRQPVNRILTQDWVDFMRSPTGRRIPNKVLAQWTGVHESTVSLARSGRNWGKTSPTTKGNGHDDQ